MFTPAAGTIIAGRYALIEEIGRGGMGSVWKAQHQGLDAAVAIKFMLGERGQDAGARQRFLSEARGAARVQSPYVTRVFDVAEWEGVPYIAMELLEGETLEARLQQAGALSPKLTCTIVDQIALGLTRAHAARLVHRDLKPANVFLVRQEVGEPLLVKLLDFGLAKQLGVEGPHATQSGMLLGTPGYMSPEQALGPKVVDERADLWSLAAIAYHCLTGKEPFPGEALAEVLLQIVHGPLPVPSQINPALGAAFDAWWQRAAHRDRAARPSSAQLLAQELRVALGLVAQPSVPSDERATLALGKTESVSVHPFAALPVATPPAQGNGAAHAVTIPSLAVISLAADDAVAVPALLAAASAPEASAKSRRDTLQPAIELHPRRLDGLPLYALVAVGFAALGSGGLLYWRSHRAALADEEAARRAKAISAAPAAVAPPPEPEALPAPAVREAPASPATPMPPEAAREAPRAPAQRRARASAAAAQPPPNGSGPATEKKHERLGF